jgi:hypothetical protein
MSRTHRVDDWFQEVAKEVQADWDRLHAAALKDPQRAGHGGEATWAQLLEKWLPSSYEVATRRYILPETEDAPEPSETDIVIFSPGYPKALRNKEEVIAGGVAAAFSVRLTLDADGIRDATSRAAEIRRHIKPRYGTIRGELLGPFPVVQRDVGQARVLAQIAAQKEWDETTLETLKEVLKPHLVDWAHATAESYAQQLKEDIEARFPARPRASRPPFRERTPSFPMSRGHAERSKRSH